MDALAAVSLDSTERQQPLVVTVAKRRQQPTRVRVAGRAVAIPWGSPDRTHLPPDVPAAHALAGRQPQPPLQRALQPEQLRIGRWKNVPRGGRDRYHSFIRDTHGFLEEVTGESSHRWSAMDGGYSLASAGELGTQCFGITEEQVVSRRLEGRINSVS